MLNILRVMSHECQFKSQLRIIATSNAQNMTLDKIFIEASMIEMKWVMPRNNAIDWLDGVFFYTEIYLTVNARQQTRWRNQKTEELKLKVTQHLKMSNKCFICAPCRRVVFFVVVQHLCNLIRFFAFLRCQKNTNTHTHQKIEDIANVMCPFQSNIKV